MFSRACGLVVNHSVRKNKRYKRLSGKTRWNLMQSVRRLAAVLLLEATVFMSVFNTWGGAWMQQMYGTIRPDVFEVFGGHAEVSSQAWSQGWLTLQPLDITYGTDLRGSEEREDLVQHH